MNQSQSKSRAGEVWARFRGMFGTDALARKFGAEPPVEWEAMLSRLTDFQIDRGLKRLAYSGKGHVPTLPEFTRLCRALGEDDFDTPQAPRLPAPDTWKGDGWEVSGNLRLLKFITTSLAQQPRLFGNPRTEQHELNVDRLVAYKRAWSQDMREYVNDHTGECGKPDTSYQERTFADCMHRAVADMQA